VQGAAFVEQQSLQGVHQILEQVEAVGDLDRLGRATTGTVGIELRTIAADDAHAWMLSEPGGESVSLALRQQIDGTMGFQVDQDGAVPIPFAEGPIIDAKDPRGWPVRERSLANEAQQGGWASRVPQSVDEPCARLSA
jgi:hypothetical protein